MRWPLKAHLVFGAIAISALTHVVRATAQDPETALAVSTQMIPDNAVAAVMIFPQEILSAPEIKILPIEVADAWMVENIGVDLSGIESLTCVIGATSPVPSQYGFWIQFKQDRDAITLKPMGFDGPAMQVAGHSAIPSNHSPDIYLHRVDPRNYVAATGGFLDAMLTPSAKPGPLAQLVASRKRQTPILAAMVTEPVRDQIKDAAKEKLWGVMSLEGLEKLVLDPLNLIEVVSAGMRVSPEPLNELPRAAVTILRHTEAVLIEASLPTSGLLRLTWVANSADEIGPLTKLLVSCLNVIGRALDAPFEAYQLAITQALQPIGARWPVLNVGVYYLQGLVKGLVKESNEMYTHKLEGRELVVQLDRISGADANRYARVGLLMSALPLVSEAAGRISSRRNLKEILLAFRSYHNTHRKLPSPFLRDPRGKPLLSWRVTILPFIGQEALYSQFRLDEPWDSEHNLKLIERMPSIYNYPGLALPPGMTVFHVPSGDDMLFRPSATVRFSNVTDGLGTTIAVFVANADAAVPWTKPADAQVDQADPLANMSKHRPTGFNVGFAGGTVRFISNQIDPRLFWAMLTRTGGEPVQLP